MISHTIELVNEECVRHFGSTRPPKTATDGAASS